MNEDCNLIDEVLEKGDPDAMEQLERHAASCETCARRIADLERLSTLAKSLHVEWESPALWDRIERDLEESSRARHSAARFRRPSAFLRVAATILLVAGLAFVAMHVVRSGPPPADQAAFDRWVVRESAIEDVERAEKNHLASIDRLSKLAAPELQHDDSPLALSYREKLMLIDDAIAECQSQIETNRYNSHLRRQLLAMYQEKDQTLRDLLKENRHEQ